MLTCHTPGYTPTVLHHLLVQAMRGQRGEIEAREMLLAGDRDVLAVPSGAFAGWCATGAMATAAPPAQRAPLPG